MTLQTKTPWTSQASRTANIHQLLHVSREIDEIAILDPGWDGDNAPALSGLVASRAFLLMLSLEATADGRIPPPAMSAPIIDGGLQLEWNSDQVQIEVQVAPDGTFGYLLVHDPSGTERSVEDDDLTVTEIAQVIQDAFHR